ncbi:hypothetical protein ACHAWC_011736 [Mediolabrus comicus]
MSSSSPSIFDRLSQQGTVASRQRDAEEKQSRMKQEQLRKKNEAALTPTKNDRKLKAMMRSPIPQDQSATKKKQPVNSDALYERLAKQDTISSAAHHSRGHGNNNSNASTSSYTSPKRTDSQRNATFNRLYKQDTAASKAHHQPPEDKSMSSKKKVNITPPPSLLKRLEDKSKTTSSDAAAAGPTIPLQMNVYIRNTTEKKDGKSYTTLNLTQKEVRKQINLYATTKKISPKSLCYDIINALFHRDFTNDNNGRHWKIASATVEELDVTLDTNGTLLNADEKKGLNDDDDDIKVFEVMKEAIWDYKDVYRVAKSYAKIKISSESVYVDEYSYTVSG